MCINCTINNKWKYLAEMKDNINEPDDMGSAEWILKARDDIRQEMAESNDTFDVVLKRMFMKQHSKSVYIGLHGELKVATTSEDMLLYSQLLDDGPVNEVWSSFAERYNIQK